MHRTFFYSKTKIYSRHEMYEEEVSEECNTRRNVYKFSQETRKEEDNWELDVDSKIMLKCVSRGRVLGC